MLGSLLIMGGLGIVVGLGLALASKVFYVYVDPKIEAIEDVLPGANCGGCGLPGCSANAEAVVQGTASPTSCVAGGAELAAEIADILGVRVVAKEPDIAKPGCTYGFQDADLKYVYNGAYDCRAAALLHGGFKVCPIGCLGLGTCVTACPFGALSIGADNLPVVDADLCTGCGTCERVCPKSIITLTSNSRIIQDEYTTDECTAPCQRACPAGIDIPVYINHIKEGNYSDAVRTIKEKNPFPLVCGRICVHPCEYECRRNHVDESVAINYLKRFAADHEMNSGQRIQIPRGPETGNRIAVIGGGAEGLTAAYFINRLGHDVTVYEGSRRLGGMLRIGLPSDRLPRDVLDWEIKGILDAGVQAITDKKLGRDFTVSDLIGEGFSAVFVATGGWDTFLTEGAPGGGADVLPGLHLLVDSLRHEGEGTSFSQGENVMILGGGNAAVAGAMKCLAEGAGQVTVLMRTSRDRVNFSEGILNEAEGKGVQFRFESAVTKLIGRTNQLTQVEIARTSEMDEGEREKRELISVNRLLTASGRFPELIFIPRHDDDQDAPAPGEDILWETLFPYPSPLADQDTGIFRPGEVISDYRAAVEAIGSGRRAANSIHRHFMGETLDAPVHMIRHNSHVLNLDRLEPVRHAHRERMPERSRKDRATDPSLEVELGYSEGQARSEAERCLQCGLICYRRIKESLS